MSSGTISVNLCVGVVGNWSETYKWIPIFGAFLSFATAFSAGANSLPVPFSSTVGSSALTLLQASVVACMINVPGAALSSNGTVHRLFSDFLKGDQPNEGFLMWSMVTVLITAIIWLSFATYMELPVSSQQTMQSALLGTMLATRGFDVLSVRSKSEAHAFNGMDLLRIAMEWIAGPVIAGVIGFCFFKLLKVLLLRRENAEKRVLIFLPFYYGISAGLLCFFILYQVISHLVTPAAWEVIVAVTLATVVAALLSLIVVVPLTRKRLEADEKASISKCSKSRKPSSDLNHGTEVADNKAESDDEKFENALKAFMEKRVLDTVYEEDEGSWASPAAVPESQQVSPLSSVTTRLTPLKQLLTPSRLAQKRDFQRIEKSAPGRNRNFSRVFTDQKTFTFFPKVIEYDRKTLVRHALAEKFDQKMEDLFRFPHLLVVSIFVLVQSANEIAASVSPFEAITDVLHHRNRYSGNGEDLGTIEVRWWLRAAAGLTASLGFFLCGWRLTHSLGGKLTYTSNSRALSSQFSAVTIMILATKMKFPLSCTHAFIGSLLGVGIADDARNVNWKLLLKYVCGWIGGICFCCLLSYGLYSFSVQSPAYVVP